MDAGESVKMNNTELDDLKRWLQTIFTDKLVIIVGSGLSCAEGLPGMRDLGEKLKREIPSKISDENLKTWSEIAACLESDGLEGALLKHPANDEIESAIIKITAEYVLNKEIFANTFILIIGSKPLCSTYTHQTHMWKRR